MSRLTIVFALILLGGCGVIHRIETKAAKINQLDEATMQLAQQNRNLQAKISELEYQVNNLESQNQFLSIQLEKHKKKGRGIASVAPAMKQPAIDDPNDLVKFHTYNWSPSQLWAIGEKEFKNKNYEKAAQFFHTYLEQRESHLTVDDEILFQSGIAAYESGKHYDWSKKYFNELVNNHPTSKYYRGAKIWLALSNLKQGNVKAFHQTFDEFRMKYRNTPEWKILSGYYEEITQNYE